MAVEKFIRGKCDSAAHDGRASNVRRLQSAEYHQANWQEEAEPITEIPLVYGRPLRVLRRGKEHLLSQEGVMQGVWEEGLLDENLHQRQGATDTDRRDA